MLPNLQAHCQRQNADQIYIKERAKAKQDKFVFKKSLPSKKIKTHRTAETSMTHKLKTENGLQGQ